MSRVRLTRDFPHPPAKVWRALTEPEVMGRWGMAPKGYRPQVGTRFRLEGTPNRRWRGWVDCEVLEVRPGELIRYSWDADGKMPVTEMTIQLEPLGDATRLTLEHSGFIGVAGFVFGRMVMLPGLRHSLRGLARVLGETR